MTTTQFGSFPGVRAIITPGGIAGVQVGREQKLVLFGHGDTDAGNADPNTPTQVATRIGPRNQFGEGSELALAMEDAVNNGANLDFVYGVAPEITTVSGDTGRGDTGEATKLDDGEGTLTNAPIVEDTETITVTNTSTSTDEDPVFRHESPPDPASVGDGEVAINPNTGEVASSGSDSYEVAYQHMDWQAALDAADRVLNHNETGIYCTLSDSENVSRMLSDKVDELRPTWKLVKGLSGAQPNATNDSGEASFDTENYTDSLDNDAMFLAGPTRIRGFTDQYRSILGGLAGVFAGHSLINPIHGDPISGYTGLTQSLTRPQEQQLVGGSQVIPISDDQRDGGAGLRLVDNVSTSTATGWTRDFHRIRIIDQVLMIGKEIGESARSNLMSDTLLRSVQEDYEAELEGLVNAGLLKSSREGTLTNNNLSSSDDSRRTDDDDNGRQSGGSNDQREERYFVEVSRAEADTIAIAVGFTPVGIARNIDETIIISE